MPIHLRKAFRSRGAFSGIWGWGICSHTLQGEALLDHKELMGTELGRGRILQDLQGSQRLWGGLNGLNRICSEC